MVVKTGAFSYLQWGEEDVSYGVPPVCTGDVDKPFGYEQKITNWSFTNNPIVLQQLDNIHLKNYAFGRTQGSISIDAVLANPFWLRNIFGAPVASGCADPFTCTYAIICACHEYLGNSFTIEVGYENAAADITRQLSGAIFNSVSLTSTVGETVKATFDISYASEKEACVCIDASPAAEVISGSGNFIPYTFAHAQLETNETTACMCCSTVLVSEVQCLDFTINPQQEMLWGIGSNAATSSFKKFFELTGSFKSPWKDTAEYDNVKEQLSLDGTCEDREQFNLIVTFSNGVCGAGQRDQVWTFSGINIRSFDVTVEPNEPMWQTIPWQARTVGVVANVGAVET